MSIDADFARARATYEMAKGDVDELPVPYSNEECDLLVDAQFEALDALMLAPAPDFASLTYKMQIFAGDFGDGCFDLNNHEELFASLIADVRRLGRVQ